MAALLWLHRRSEEPSVTSVDCYWKKSKLSSVGTSLKYVTLNELSLIKVPALPDIGQDFYNDVVVEGAAKRCEGIIFQSGIETNTARASLHRLALLFKMTDNRSVDGFKVFISNALKAHVCVGVERETRSQAKSASWYEVRYGRITASRLYEASKCKMYGGSLTETILGASKVIETVPMKRGKVLEDQVIQEISKQYQFKINKTGIFLKPEYPVFGASPDALSKTHCFEVKCPSKEKTISNFVDEYGTLRPKVFAQIQLQMLLTDRQSAYCCIASPTFETSREFQMIEVEYDRDACDTVMKNAEDFFNNAIFVHLMKS